MQNIDWLQVVPNTSGSTISQSMAGEKKMEEQELGKCIDILSRRVQRERERRMGFGPNAPFSRERGWIETLEDIKYNLDNAAVGLYGGGIWKSLQNLLVRWQKTEELCANPQRSDPRPWDEGCVEAIRWVLPAVKELLDRFDQS